MHVPFDLPWPEPPEKQTRRGPAAKVGRPRPRKGGPREPCEETPEEHRHPQEEEEAKGRDRGSDVPVRPTVRRLGERDFRSLAEGVSDAIVVTDASGRIGWANGATTVVFGYGREELVERPVEILLPQRIRERHARAVARSVRNEAEDIAGTSTMVTGLRKDGEEIPLEVSLSTSGEGEDRLFFVCLRDVSERQASEEALEELTHLHELILNSTAESILVVGGTGRVRFLNRALTEMTGWSEETLLGEEMHGILHRSPREEGLPRECCPVLSPLRDGRAHRGTTTFFRRDGSELKARFSSSPILLDEGEAGAVVLFEDITGRIRLEDQLRQAQRMETVGLLTGGIAHDFNNLLSVILLSVEAIESTLEPAGNFLRSGLRDIREAAESAAEMAGKLLGFGRNAPLNRTPLNLAEVVGGMRSMLRRVIPETIDLRLTLGGEKHPVEADAGAVEQILLNLVTNARDAMPRGGELAIEVVKGTPEDPHRRDHSGGYTRISVRDTGMGMTPETLERVFDPFYTTKEPGRGTGLGLAMVYGLVERHGGQVEISSEPGEGTEVHLFFPTFTGDMEVERAQDGKETRPLEGNERILVVEDEKAVLDMAARTLERQGYHVLPASEGEMAMEILVERGGDVDLVLADLIMPRKGGMSLLKEARNAGYDMPFLFTSGYLVEEDREAMLAGENVHFLAKPWRNRSFLLLIRDILDETDQPTSSPEEGSSREDSWA